MHFTLGYWSGDILHWKSTEYILVYGLIGFGGGNITKFYYLKLFCTQIKFLTLIHL